MSVRKKIQSIIFITLIIFKLKYSCTNKYLEENKILMTKKVFLKNI